jgi:hypothetical protein
MIVSNVGCPPKAVEDGNAENLLVIHDRRLAAFYAENWQEHARHSDGQTRKGR